MRFSHRRGSRRSKTHFPLALAPLLLPVLAFSCNDDPSSKGRGVTPTSSTSHPSVLKGIPSDESQDSVVMLVAVTHNPQSPLGICTATLIAPRLVVTARHCVALANESVACLSDGTPQSGGEVTGNRDPKDLFVFTGRDRPNLDMATWKPSGSVTEIIDDASGNLCNHDISLLLLRDPIDGVPISPIRLDDTSAGESLITVGWGITSGEIEPTRRQQRSGVTVKRVGPSDLFPILTKTEILFDESICLGDSGGPIFSEQTKALVAVVSRGGNGADFDIKNPGSTCVEADNLGTRLAPFKDIINRGFERAGAQPKLEDKPDDDSCCVCRVGMPHSLDGHSPSSLTVGMGVFLGLLTFVRRGLRRPKSLK